VSHRRGTRDTVYKLVCRRLNHPFQRRRNLLNICIPIQEDKGLKSEICIHFGSAARFIVVDTDTLAYRVVSTGIEAAEGNPVDLITRDPIDSVVVGGIGVRSLCDLREAGVDVVSTREDRVDDIVASFKEGDVNEINLDHTCRLQQRGRGFRGFGGCGGGGHCR
jgi:predicted Fe-Mo cluster-binding NifX family protein